MLTIEKFIKILNIQKEVSDQMLRSAEHHNSLAFNHDRDDVLYYKGRLSMIDSLLKHINKSGVCSDCGLKKED